MKNIVSTLIIVIGIAATASSQVINKIIIGPSNPTEHDTISVISNFTFYGNCSFGLVDYSVHLIGSTIQIAPFYIGNQYRLFVHEKEYRIDLLLFHRKLQSLIAVDLKVGAFRISRDKQKKSQSGFFKPRLRNAQNNDTFYHLYR